MAMMMGAGLPQHDSWAGAIWGGTKAAAERVYDASKLLVKGEIELPNGQTHEIERGRILKGLPGMISDAFKVHTFSVRQPEALKKLQAHISQFQHGR